MYAIGSYLTTVVDCGATMAFALIDAVRNLRSRSNRVRTARHQANLRRRLATPGAARCSAMRHSSCSSASRSVADDAPSPDIAGGPHGAHCTATAAATAVATVVLACSVALCCALLRSAAAAQRPAVVANKCRGGVSPRRRGSAPTRSSPRASRLRRAVDAADLQGERALRPAQVRHWDRTVQVRRAPPAARSVRKSERGAVAGHGTRAWHCDLDQSALSLSCRILQLARRGGVRWKRRRCCFLLRGRWTFVLRAGRGAAAHAGGAGMAAAACGAAKCEACILCVVSGYSCRVP